MYVLGFFFRVWKSCLMVGRKLVFVSRFKRIFVIWLFVLLMSNGFVCVLSVK